MVSYPIRDQRPICSSVLRDPAQTSMLQHRSVAIADLTFWKNCLQNVLLGISLPLFRKMLETQSVLPWFNFVRERPRLIRVSLKRVLYKVVITVKIIILFIGCF